MDEQLNPKLVNLILKLISDPELLESFNQDAETILDSWDPSLTAEEKDAVLSRDSRTLREALSTLHDIAAAVMVGFGQ